MTSQFGGRQMSANGCQWDELLTKAVEMIVAHVDGAQQEEDDEENHDDDASESGTAQRLCGRQQNVRSTNDRVPVRVIHSFVTCWLQANDNFLRIIQR